MQDIVDRIAKLLALANSPNENEATAAAAKASELNGTKISTNIIVSGVLAL